MFVTDDDRREAARLGDLDDRGRRIEAVAIALSARRQADESAAELAELDRGIIDEIAKRVGSGGEGASSGTEHLS